MTCNLLAALNLFLIISFSLSGKDKQQPFYPVASIDSSLKKDAWAVCRDFHQEFVLQDNGHAVEKVRMVLTVLEKRGDEYAELELPYDQTSKITSITGKTYNAAGFVDDKLRTNAIQDVNYTSDGAIFDDLRMKTAKINSNDYPYTIEYNFEISYDGLLGYPTWHPAIGYHFAVEKSFFTISFPEEKPIRFRELNLPSGCRTEKAEKGIKTMEWNIHSLNALKEEPFSPKISLFTPSVITAPVEFEYCKTSGTMNSWSEFGQWIDRLVEGRDQLPPARVNEIKELIKGLRDTSAMVCTLYNYLQQHTHYVGIQLGIGGYQPFPAETVDKLGYGDCKALSNYMKAMLKVAGIASSYTVAGAAHSQGITMTDFPTANQCNHVILCVPLRKDTIWLECTSQSTPCGYLGSSTAGRKVLIVDSAGSRIVTTPLLSAEESSQNRNAAIIISESGKIDAAIKTQYKGYQYDNISAVLTETTKEQEKKLHENLSLTGLTITSFGYSQRKSKIPEATETIQLTSPTCATKSGSRIFIPVNLFNQLKSIPSHVENRKSPVYREFAYMDTDTITFRLPTGFVTESIPHGKSLATPFGEYNSTLALQGDKLLYTRKLKMYRGTWPKERYDELVDFYTAIFRADNLKVVIKEAAK